MQEDFLANIEQEGQKSEDVMDLLTENNEQEDTTADSPSEDDQTEEINPSQEGEQATNDEPTNTPDEDNLPFHKHPRWKQLQEDKAAQEKLNAELQATIQQLQEKSEVVKPDDSLPQEFVELYGDDEVARKAYALQQKQMAGIEERIREQLITRQAEEARKEQEQTNQWDAWVDFEITTLVEAGEKFDRNKLMKIAVDFQPTDQQGNISFKKALDIYKLQDATTKPTNSANKKVAAMTASNNQGDSKVDSSPSTNSLRGRSMQSLALE